MTTPELTVKELNEVFWRSEIGQKMIAQSRAETIAARQAAADAIVAIEKKTEVDWAKADKVFRKAEAEYQTALRGLQDAERARREAYGDRRNITVRAGIAKSSHEKVLRDTADPAIHSLAVLVSRAYGLPATVADLENTESLARANERKSNQLEVLRELDELWREPLTNQQLTARLEVLRRRAFPESAFATSAN